MPEIGEIVAVTLPTTDKVQKTYACKWQDCKRKHYEDINPTYPNNGSTVKPKATSGKDYEDDWIDEGLEPWEEKGPGRNPKTTYKAFTADLDPSAQRSSNLIEKALEEFTYPRYLTQKHHIISVDLFKNFPKLAHNAKLIGYNCNDKENGLCLPYFRANIVNHGRQCHRGKHSPSYDSKVSALLKNLQDRCIDYCSQNIQAILKPELEFISRRVRNHILNWDTGWYVRSTALADRTWAYNRIR